MARWGPGRSAHAWRRAPPVVPAPAPLSRGVTPRTASHHPHRLRARPRGTSCRTGSAPSVAGVRHGAVADPAPGELPESPRRGSRPKAAPAGGARCARHARLSCAPGAAPRSPTTSRSARARPATWRSCGSPEASRCGPLEVATAQQLLELDPERLHVRSELVGYGQSRRLADRVAALLSLQDVRPRPTDRVCELLRCETQGESQITERSIPPSNLCRCPCRHD